MEVLDSGHKYKLASLDGECEQTLTFVKRMDIDGRSRFPGNDSAYPGTTIQNVFRALLNRMRYLQNQVWCVENVAIILFLRVSLWLMEFRAARRHGKFYFKSFSYAEFAPMCDECLHTFCKHENKTLTKP